jgi:malonyl-CoA/methylmalonyl-CoA synthetase
LLERYGMTEFAMALSNPYHEVSQQQQRHPGHVGLPLPSVQVRLVVDEEDDDDSNQLLVTTPNTPGALQVKGPTVFQEYWNRPNATQEAFTEDGWFHTGDVAEYNADLDSYRILGRASVDILKVGGHKLSALEIERELLEYDEIIAEVVVVGIPDEVWGQRVGMIARRVVTSKTTEVSLEDIQEWCALRVAKYKIPTKLLWVEEIPKNAMGKVNKKELVKLFL